MADNQDININIKFDNKELKESLNQVNTQIKTFSDKAGSSFSDLFKMFAGAEIGGKIKDMFTGFVDAGSNLQFMAQTTKENVRVLATWEEAAKRAGGTAQGYASTLNAVHKRMQAASMGRDTDFVRFSSMAGVSLLDKNGQLKKTSQYMEDLGQALQKMPENARQPLAQSLGIDDDTYRLISMNKKSLDSLLDSVKDAGVMSAEQAQAAVQTRNEWLKVGQTYTQVGYQISEGLLPVVNELGKALEWTIKLISGNHIFNESGGRISFNTDSALVRHSTAAQILKKIDPSRFTSAKALMNSGAGSIHVKPVSNSELQKMVAQMSPLERAQMMQESGGNPNPPHTSDLKESEKTYGLFQMRLSTAKEYDPNATVAKLLDPMYNKRLHDQMMAKGWKLSGGSVQGALAYYNGGMGGLRHWQRTGQSYNNYAENVIAKSRSYQPPISQPMLAANGGTPQSRSAQPGGNNKNGMGGVNMHISNVNVMGQTNPTDFADQMVKSAQPNYAFSSGQSA